MELPEMRGRALTAVDASATPDQWLFQFGDGCFINVECDWRIVSTGRVVLAPKDHQQLFGREEPVDAVKVIMSLLGGKNVTRASLGRAGDLVLEFDGTITLETFTDSSGYESCTIGLGNGKQLVVVGGGEVVEF